MIGRTRYLDYLRMTEPEIGLSMRRRGFGTPAGRTLEPDADVAQLALGAALTSRQMPYPAGAGRYLGADMVYDQGTGQGATPILGRAQARLHEGVMDRLRRDGVQDFIATGIGASPVLGRAQDYLAAERIAAMGGGPLPTGMGATPILERARLSLDQEVLNTAIGNGPKIQSAITSEVEPALTIRSGGATLPDPWLDSATVPRQAAPAAAAGNPVRYLGADMVYDQGTGQGATTIRPPVAEPANVSGGGEGTSTAKGQSAINRGRARRGMGSAIRGAASTALQPAFGPPDLGLGGAINKGLKNLSRAEALQGNPGARATLSRLGGFARVGLPAAALATPLLPVAMGAAEGYGDAGVGGALIQGGTAALGTLAGGAAAGALAGSVVPGFGTVVGAVLGGLAASALGKGLTGVAQGATEKAQMGDTGFMGGIGRAIDPLIDTPFEKEQKQVLQQMYSPAMLAIKEQERTREARARADMAYQALMQSYMS